MYFGSRYDAAELLQVLIEKTYALSRSTVSIQWYDQPANERYAPVPKSVPSFKPRRYEARLLNLLSSVLYDGCLFGEARGSGGIEIYAV